MKNQEFRFARCAALVLFALLFTAAFGLTASAAGSRELVANDGDGDGTWTYNAGSYRPYIEWYASKTYSNGAASLARQQTISVYAKAGETLLFGSSVADAGVSGDTDILLTDPSGASASYAVTKDRMGYISAAQELYGPSNLRTDALGYTALEYPVTATGIYTFCFYSPTPNSPSSSIAKLVSDSSAWQTDSQRAGVAAWDVTVMGTNGAAVTGRVFTNFLSLTVGTVNNVPLTTRVLDATVHVLTNDGYMYSTDFNGINPNGFLFFANGQGLYDGATGQTLYHSALYGDDDSSVLLGGVRFTLPGASTAFKLFLEQPDLEFLGALGLSSPAEPVRISALTYSGGVFTFTADRAGAYELALTIDAAAGNVVYLRGSCAAGQNVVRWDGLDANGAVVPNGSYTVTAIGKAGEYHFPLADVEVACFGLEIHRLNGTGGDPYTVYYDNSSTTLNGDALDFNAGSQYFTQPLTALTGVSSQKDASGISRAMRFTSPDQIVGANGYGNRKLFDVWAYASSSSVTASFEVGGSTPPVTPVPPSQPNPTPIPTDEPTYIPDDYVPSGDAPVLGGTVPSALSGTSGSTGGTNGTNGTNSTNGMTTIMDENVPLSDGNPNTGAYGGFAWEVLPCLPCERPKRVGFRAALR